MKTTFNSVQAVVLGLLAAVFIIFASEILSHILYPPPAGLDFNDTAALAAAMSQLPLGAFVAVLIGWALGTTGGAWVAARRARSAPLTHALILGALLFAAALGNMWMLPHPRWFELSALALFPIAAVLGGILARRRNI